MDIPATLGLTIAALIGSLAGNLLTTMFAYNTHKAELKERQRQDRIKYLRETQNTLIESWAEIANNTNVVQVPRVINGNMPSPGNPRYKAIMLAEATIIGIDDKNIQSVTNDLENSKINIGDALRLSIKRLGEMLNQEML